MRLRWSATRASGVSLEGERVSVRGWTLRLRELELGAWARPWDQGSTWVGSFQSSCWPEDYTLQLQEARARVVGEVITAEVRIRMSCPAGTWGGDPSCETGHLSSLKS